MAFSVTAFIRQHDAGRLAALLPLRYQRLRSSAFAFFRGTAPLYYHRFAAAPTLLASPTAWLCGDAHVENFGSYRADNGLVYFDINDFDEAVRGPVLWDVGRLTTSVLLAATEWGMPPAEGLLLGCQLLAEYAAALAVGKAYWVERATATGVVGRLLRGTTQRGPRQLLRGRARYTDGDGWHLCAGPAVQLLSRAEHATAWAALHAWQHSQPGSSCGRLLDVAQRVAGIGSLGVRRYAVLAEHRHPRPLPGLFDFKQAAPAAAAGLGFAQPTWASEAQRVVQAQTWLQAVPPSRLQAVSLQGEPFVLRALQPVADHLAFDTLAHRKRALRSALPTFARLLAWAHLRAAGHLGAAGPDALRAFGQAHADWRTGVLAFAQQAAQQVRADHAAFCAVR